MGLRGTTGLLFLVLLLLLSHYQTQAKQQPGGRRGRRCEIPATYQDQLRTLEETQEELRGEVAALHFSLASLASSLVSLTSLVTSTLPEDCSAALARGSWTPLVKIHPPGLTPREVRCNQNVDDGGWTVVLSRYPHSTQPHPTHPEPPPTRRTPYPPRTYPHPERRTSFNRTWEEYKNGFGDLNGEFWIGNEVLHALTRHVALQLRVDISDWVGNVATATWDQFRVGSEEEDYRLSIGRYHQGSSAKDDLQRHDQRPFSTYDHDNDRYERDHCARQYGGGWWYFSCYDAHLTGVALMAGETGHHGIVWRSWTEYLGLMNATMMIRPMPRPCSP